MELMALLTESMGIDSRLRRRQVSLLSFFTKKELKTAPFIMLLVFVLSSAIWTSGFADVWYKGCVRFLTIQTFQLEVLAFQLFLVRRKAFFYRLTVPVGVSNR